MGDKRAPDAVVARIVALIDHAFEGGPVVDNAELRRVARVKLERLRVAAAGDPVTPRKGHGAAFRPVRREAPSGDPCPRCGIPMSKGCEHFAPFVRPDVAWSPPVYEGRFQMKRRKR